MYKKIEQLEAEYGITGKEGFKEALFDWIESCIPKEKNMKLIGNSELTTDEMIKEYNSHGKNVINIESNEIKVYKAIDNEEK